MPIVAGEFATLADEFMNTEFAALAKVLTLRTPDAPVYGSPQTYTTEAGTGISLELNITPYTDPLVQTGDHLIFTNASQWTTVPRVDNIDLIFDGITCSIILVEKDADNAAYFITAREK